MIINFIDQAEIDQSNIYEIPFEEEYQLTPLETSTQKMEQSSQEQIVNKRERMLQKRLERKSKKIKRVEEVKLSKEELRKQRNRNSAQLSRDRKKAEHMALLTENEQLKQQLFEKDQIIQALEEENCRLKQKVNFVEEFGQPERVRVITQSHLKNYGFLALLSVVCIISLMSTVELNSQAAYNIPQFKERIPQDNTFLQNSFQQEQEENNLTHYPLAIPESRNIQTLFLDCNAGEEGCHKVLNVYRAERAENVYIMHDDTTYHNSSILPKVGDENIIMRIDKIGEGVFHIQNLICKTTQSYSHLYQEDQNFNSTLKI